MEQRRNHQPGARCEDEGNDAAHILPREEGYRQREAREGENAGDALHDAFMGAKSEKPPLRAPVSRRRYLTPGAVSAAGNWQSSRPPGEGSRAW